MIDHPCTDALWGATRWNSTILPISLTASWLSGPL